MSIRRYIGRDTRSNFWSSPPPPLGLDLASDITTIDDCTCSPYDFPGFSHFEIEYMYRYKYWRYGFGGPGPGPGPCAQLVRSGHAEIGDWSAWQAWPIEDNSTIALHHQGPTLNELAFKHIGRINANSGPGQYFDKNCFVAGMVFEIIAKIKLIDVNGFSYACTGNKLTDLKCCPVLTIVIVLPTGEHRYLDKWNDIKHHDI